MKPKMISKEQQKAWDILRTPAVETKTERLERLIVQTLKPYAYEQNDDITRRAVASELTQMFDHLMNRRDIVDYSVICDATNNPKASVNLKCDVNVMVSPPAGFIHMPVSIRTA